MLIKVGDFYVCYYIGYKFEFSVDYIVFVLLSKIVKKE